MACKAWKTAKETLEAQREAYEQSRKDSIAQTRPYISATIVPGLQGMGIYDLLIKNSGKSAARNLEAYSQAARRPVKPLVGARLRMAVNKPPYTKFFKLANQIRCHNGIASRADANKTDIDSR